MSNEINEQVEIQKLLLFLNSIGICMFGAKKINFYKSSFLVIIITTILNVVSESEKKINAADFNKMMPKYVATLFYVIVLIFYYRLYKKYEINIHQMNAKGKFKIYEKHILYILIIILVMELLFIINSDKNGNTEIIGIAFILYILTLRLIILAAYMYRQLRHKEPIKSDSIKDFDLF